MPCYSPPRVSRKSLALLAGSQSALEQVMGARKCRIAVVPWTNFEEGLMRVVLPCSVEAG